MGDSSCRRPACTSGGFVLLYLIFGRAVRAWSIIRENKHAPLLAEPSFDGGEAVFFGNCCSARGSRSQSLMAETTAMGMLDKSRLTSRRPSHRWQEPATVPQDVTRSFRDQLTTLLWSRWSWRQPGANAVLENASCFSSELLTNHFCCLILRLRSGRLQGRARRWRPKQFGVPCLSWIRYNIQNCLKRTCWYKLLGRRACRKLPFSSKLGTVNHIQFHGFETRCVPWRRASFEGCSPGPTPGGCDRWHLNLAQFLFAAEHLWSMVLFTGSSGASPLGAPSWH